MGLGALSILDATLEEIELRWPKRSATIARVLIYLIRRQSTTIADMSDALGHGRDSTLIQKCCANLEEIGVVRSTATKPKTLTLVARPRTGWRSAERTRKSLQP